MMHHTSHHLLLIDAHPEDVQGLAAVLTTPGALDADLTVVDGVRAAEHHLADRVADVIVIDPASSDVHGWDAVRRVRAAAPHVPVLVWTRVDQDALGADVSPEDVQEYLIKGQVGARGLLRSVRAALERQALEDALFVERDRAHVTLTSIGDAVVCTDVTGQVTFLNLAAETITGSSQEAAGRPMAEVCAILDAHGAPIPDPMRRAIARDRTGHLPPNCVLRRRDGQEIPVEDSVAPIHNRRGQVIGAVIVFRDVTAMRAMAVQMSHAAHHDFLTGLPNRLLLRDRVRQAIAAAPRHGHQVAVLFLDLDNFKHINDSLGHTVGDQLLQSIARRLVACIRQADTVSRQGGDEFVVVLADVDGAGGPASPRPASWTPSPRCMPSSRTICMSPRASGSVCIQTTAWMPTLSSRMQTPRCTRPKRRGIIATSFLRQR
jgi:PAS domain S-box-containing protein